MKIVRADKNLKDPADIVRENPEAFAKVISEAEPAIRFYLRRYLGEGSSLSDPMVLKKGIRKVLEKVQIIASPVEQAYWFREISGVTGIPERSLTAEMALLKTPTTETKAATPEVQRIPKEDQGPLPRKDLILQRILSLAVSEPSLQPIIEQEVSIFGEPYQELFRHIARGEAMPPDLVELADLISMGGSLAPTGVLAKTELQELMKELKIVHYRSERERLTRVIRAAENAGDMKTVQSALEEHSKIPRSI